MPRAAVLMLENLLRPSDKGLEFGSGRSTLWLSGRVHDLVSVEENESWAQKVRQMVRDRQNVSIFLYNLNDYVSVLEDIEDSSLDFCIIDGALRDACAIRSIPKIKAGGLLLVDDVHRYLPLPPGAPTLRSPKAPASPDWQAFWDIVCDWRQLWFDDGVSATVIFIRA